MRKITAKQKEWLENEWDHLREKGLLSESTVSELRAYYGVEPHMGRPWALLVFGLLGAVLIGAGMILLFAHNWELLGKSTRTILAFCPLVVATVLSFVALHRRESAWSEPAGIFHTLAIGACIALIGQIYHLPSDMPGFFLTWALLALPLVFLLSATGVFTLYLALIVSWAGTAQSYSGQAMGFWLFLLPAVAWIVIKIRSARHSSSTLLSLWGLVAAMSIGVGIALEKTIPGIWIVAYAFFFGAIGLAGSQLYLGKRGWKNPLKSGGMLGMISLGFLFTWEDFWEKIGWSALRSGWRYHEMGVAVDLVMVVFLIGGWFFFLLRQGQSRFIQSLVIGFFPVLCLLCYLLQSSLGEAHWVCAALFNLFVLGFGIATVVEGARLLRLSVLNVGMAILMLLVTIRFFDSDLPFLLRGVAFILLGAGFIASNMVILRRKKGVKPLP